MIEAEVMSSLYQHQFDDFQTNIIKLQQVTAINRIQQSRMDSYSIIWKFHDITGHSLHTLLLKLILN